MSIVARTFGLAVVLLLGVLVVFLSQAASPDYRKLWWQTVAVVEPIAPPQLEPPRQCQQNR